MAAAVATACFNALMQLYAGSQPLQEEEVVSFLDSVAGYRKRGLGLAAKLQNVLAGLLGRERKLDFADKVNVVLTRVVGRSGAYVQHRPRPRPYPCPRPQRAAGEGHLCGP